MVFFMVIYPFKPSAHFAIVAYQIVQYDPREILRKIQGEHQMSLMSDSTSYLRL